MNGAALTHPSPGPSAHALFADLPPRAAGALRPRWWLLALALHLPLLLLPASLWQPERQRPPVAVELRLERAPPPTPAAAPAVPPEPVALPDPAAPAEQTRPPDMPARQAEAAAAGPSSAAPAADPKPAAAAGPAPAVPPAAASLRVERLLESVAAMDWTPPPATATIGRPVGSETAEAWARPLLPRQANALDGTVVPDSVEIVDRWQGPGGVHQVVIRAPDGNTYCGRQEPMDDFRPWTQMPMLFHRCAGGGKRSAEASWRNN